MSETGSTDNNELAELQRRLTEIEARNDRVEGEKAWEGSRARKVLIMVLTYLVVVAYSASIGGRDVFLTACVPPVGFLFSTLTFRWLKARWIKRRATKARRQTQG